MHEIVVVGAGGFGREVIDVIDAINSTSPSEPLIVRGVVDDHPAAENIARLDSRDIEFLGAVDDLPSVVGVSYVVGVGAPDSRKRLATRMEALGASPITLVHPTVSMGFGVEVGPGSVICAGVRITTNIRIGRHVHLNLNATVGHDSVLGDFVSVNPLASISGDCVVEDEVLIGVAGVVLNGLTVGAGSVVGGSACVVKDVPAGATVKGVPAR